LRELSPVFPQESSKVAQFAEFRLDVEYFVFFPAVDVGQYVGVSTAFARFEGQMLENVDFFPQT
jgi:hypothetical protein